jgi:ectoine hydroxylase-related dioxygenase (phytanoyl-CoA dioxygenase family)
MKEMNPSQHSDLFIYPQLSAEQLELYAEQGYLIVGRVLTDKGLEQVTAEVMEAWVAEKGPFDSSKTWLDNALLTEIHLRSEMVRKHYFNGPMVNVAEQVIGPNIKAVTSQLTFKMHGNTMTFAWHQDNAYAKLDPYNSISCLTVLDDTDLENGCLWLIPGSHKEGQTPFERSAEDRAALRPVELEVEEGSGIPISMKAGECMFFHCHMMHRSEGNQSRDRDRRIVFFRYADADAVEVYNDNKPRLGRLLRGKTIYPEVESYEANLPLD